MAPDPYDAERPDRPGALGRLLRRAKPVVDDEGDEVVCGKPTLRQTPSGDWVACTRTPGHRGPCR